MGLTTWMQNARTAHTKSLRERLAKGWTPRLQAEFNAILRNRADSEDAAAAQYRGLGELSDHGCYAEEEPQAYYSVGCCFWTDLPEELGCHAPTHVQASGLPAPSFSLPCCPSCGALLLQAALLKFVQAAEGNATHYGTNGIEAFWAARGAVPCKGTWDEYLCT